MHTKIPFFQDQAYLILDEEKVVMIQDGQFHAGEVPLAVFLESLRRHLEKLGYHCKFEKVK